MTKVLIEILLVVVISQELLYIGVIISMLTKEEAHWNSFRNAVGSLQQLLESESVHPPHKLSDDVINGSRDRCSNHTDGGGTIGVQEQNRNKRHNAKTSISNSQSSIIDDTCQENSSSMPKHHDVISKSSNKTWNDIHDETSQRHENNDLELNILEENTDVILTGLEEVSKNVLHSSNNMIVGGGTNNLISPTNATSHASHTTMNALSLAEQSLVETRLKLAMTESERDELEFQLIQNS